MSIEAEWIEWKGGNTVPVNTGAMIDIKTRNGSQRSAIKANELAVGYPCASAAFWRHDDDDYDITAYRIHNAFEGAPDEATHLLTTGPKWDGVTSMIGDKEFAIYTDGYYLDVNGSEFYVGPEGWQVIATRKRDDKELRTDRVMSKPVTVKAGGEPITAHNTVQAALKHMQDRATTYDKPTGERSMSATVEAFNAIAETNLTEEQGWMFMALLKIVRSQQGAFKADNYEDLAAYAGLMAEAGYSSRGA